jgi:hypothetical protein
MAGTTRLELATSAVTGQRSNQLNYVPTTTIRNLFFADSVSVIFAPLSLLLCFFSKRDFFQYNVAAVLPQPTHVVFRFPLQATVSALLRATGPPLLAVCYVNTHRGQ